VGGAGDARAVTARAAKGGAVAARAVYSGTVATRAISTRAALGGAVVGGDGGGGTVIGLAATAQLSAAVANARVFAAPGADAAATGRVGVASGIV